MILYVVEWYKQYQPGRRPEFYLGTYGPVQDATLAKLRRKMLKWVREEGGQARISVGMENKRGPKRTLWTLNWEPLRRSHTPRVSG